MKERVIPSKAFGEWKRQLLKHNSKIESEQHWPTLPTRRVNALLLWESLPRERRITRCLLSRFRWHILGVPTQILFDSYGQLIPSVMSYLYWKPVRVCLRLCHVLLTKSTWPTLPTRRVNAVLLWKSLPRERRITRCLLSRFRWHILGILTQISFDSYGQLIPSVMFYLY